MKILIVCSGTRKNFVFKYHQPFIYEQIEEIKKNYSIEYDLFTINKKGLFGYLLEYFRFKMFIKNANYDFIHAHYGLSGLFACLQKKYRVIVTFHGSDGYGWIRLFSYIVSHLSAYNIFVNEYLKSRINSNDKSTIIPCGVDLELFYPIGKVETKEKLKLNTKIKYILFSSTFDRHVKNYPLAKESLKLLDNVYLIELKNKTREEVNLLLNASEFALLTSFHEGSPQFIKEAMACNCPVVSTNVGDVQEILDLTEGCYITKFDPNDVAEKALKAIKFRETYKKTKGRDRLLKLGLDSKSIAEKVYFIYQKIRQYDM